MMLVFVLLHVVCVVIADALEFSGLGVHVEHLDNLVFGNEALIKEKYFVKRATTCALNCRKYVECMSFSVNTEMEKCRMYRSAIFRAEDGMIEANWKYYSFGNAYCPLKNSFIHSRKHALCIHLSTENFLYASGKQYCLDRGSSLISLNTTAKVNGIAEMLSMVTKSGYTFFIDLTLSGGKWRWENGNVLGPEANWGANRPRYGNGYYCAHARKNWGYKYEDHACHAYPAGIVCEHP